MNHFYKLAAYSTAVLVFLFAFCNKGVYAEGSDDSTSPPELTSESYAEIGKTGIWWIKFYSPYCTHCKDFEPAWNTVYRHLNKTYEELNFGSINCVTQGDLCSDLGIGSYPTVNLYKNGLLIEELKGARPSEHLEDYIKKQLEDMHQLEAESEKQAASHKHEENDKEKVEKEVEKEAEAESEKKPETKVREQFASYTGAGETVNTKYPDSVDPEVAEKDAEGNVNPKGISVPLNHRQFTRRVTATRDGWFIQFYSPSSKMSHSIKPAWDQMSRKAKGKLNIGQVNCDVEAQLCKEARIEQFPTLKYFASSLQTEYKGLRGTGDLSLFLKRAIDARNPPHINFSEYKKLRKTAEDITFLYLYDENTALEDFQAFEKLCVDSIGTVNIAKSNDKKIMELLKETNFPALYAVSKEKISRFPEMAPSELRNHNKLRNWATKHRQPLVPQLTPYNHQDIFANSIVVLAILDPREEESTTSAIKELRAVAVELEDKRVKEEREELEELRKKKQLKIDEAKDKNDEGAEERANQIRVEVSEREPINVAWIDAIFWERWIKGRYGSYEGSSRVVINNEKGGKFWDRNTNGDVLVPSRSDIIETLEAALSPGSKLKPTTLPTGFVSYFKGPQSSFMSTRDLILVMICFGAFTMWYKKNQAKRQFLGVQSTEGILGKLD